MGETTASLSTDKIRDPPNEEARGLFAHNILAQDRADNWRTPRPAIVAPAAV